MASKLPPRQALEEYLSKRAKPNLLDPPVPLEIILDDIVLSVLDLYDRQENTHELASRTATNPNLLGPFR